jgi:hypothetical protein
MALPLCETGTINSGIAAIQRQNPITSLRFMQR